MLKLEEVTVNSNIEDLFGSCWPSDCGPVIGAPACGPDSSSGNCGPDFGDCMPD